MTRQRLLRCLSLFYITPHGASAILVDADLEGALPGNLQT